MNCREFEKLIPDYYDGAWQGQNPYAFEGHAAVCERCRERLAEWAALSSLVKELTPVKTPEDFEARLLRKLKDAPVENPKSGFYKPRGWANVLAYAMGLIVIAVSLLMVGKMDFNGGMLSTVGPRHPSGPVAPGPSEEARPLLADDSDSMEVLLKGTGDKEVIMRLPSTIRVSAPSMNDDYYLRNVSH